MTSTSKLPYFGEIEDLIGTWKGVKGWSLIAVPVPKTTDGSPGFKLIIQNYTEILTFKPVNPMVENKGGAITQEIGALEYEQRIVDFDTKEAIHVENGMFLYLNDIEKEGQSIPPPYRVARSGTIPHGNSIMLLGNLACHDSGPYIPKLSSLPSPKDQEGVPKNFFGQYITEQERFTVRDVVTKKDSKIFDVYNPNDNLVRDNKGLDIIETTHIALSSDNKGAVQNIPFINNRANATTAHTDFWLEKIKLPMSNTTFQQLQYSQNVGIEFHKKFSGEEGLISWPHITINTLTKME